MSAEEVPNCERPDPHHPMGGLEALRCVPEPATIGTRLRHLGRVATSAVVAADGGQDGRQAFAVDRREALNRRDLPGADLNGPSEMRRPWANPTAFLLPASATTCRPSTMTTRSDPTMQTLELFPPGRALPCVQAGPDLYFSDSPASWSWPSSSAGPARCAPGASRAPRTAASPGAWGGEVFVDGRPTHCCLRGTSSGTQLCPDPSRAPGRPGRGQLAAGEEVNTTCTST